MIANYINDQHDTCDQFLREFAYAILGRKLNTPFQKLVMVSDGTEFAVEDAERLFEEARRNTKTKHEKWKKYYNRRRRDVQIKVNDWVLISTHPLSSTTTGSKEFEDYCTDEQISNVQITTGVPRGNGQVERIHGVLIPVLTKMSIEDPTK
ncbi:uncharacterized protein TNCV_2383931 [Trichonephila clavipes]|nr:uncharacterized protein TNCV_2383931 [Trichonephila clavipes]